MRENEFVYAVLCGGMRTHNTDCDVVEETKRLGSRTPTTMPSWVVQQIYTATRDKCDQQTTQTLSI